MQRHILIGIIDDPNAHDHSPVGLLPGVDGGTGPMAPRQSLGQVPGNDLLHRIAARSAGRQKTDVRHPQGLHSLLLLGDAQRHQVLRVGVGKVKPAAAVSSAEGEHAEGPVGGEGRHLDIMTIAQVEAGGDGFFRIGAVLGCQLAAVIATDLPLGHLVKEAAVFLEGLPFRIHQPVEEVLQLRLGLHIEDETVLHLLSRGIDPLEGAPQGRPGRLRRRLRRSLRLGLQLRFPAGLPHVRQLLDRRRQGRAQHDDERYRQDGQSQQPACEPPGQDKTRFQRSLLPALHDRSLPQDRGSSPGSLCL